VLAKFEEDSSSPSKQQLLCHVRIKVSQLAAFLIGMAWVSWFRQHASHLSSHHHYLFAACVTFVAASLVVLSARVPNMSISGIDYSEDGYPHYNYPEGYTPYDPNNDPMGQAETGNFSNVSG